jgi:multiple sugar transport system permease protein
MAIGKKRDNQIVSRTLTAFAFMTPALLLYTVFTIWPVISGVYVSLHKWGLMGKIRFIGLDNYSRFLTDKYFWEALWHTTWFVIITAPLLVITAIILALLANRKTIFKKFLRVSFYIPNVLSVTVLAFVFNNLFSSYDRGLISALFHVLKIWPQGYEVLWTLEPGYIWMIVDLATVWWTVGFSMMIFIAALQDIPTQVYEAASIDGASEFKQLFSITLPLLKPTTYLITLLQIIACFKIFGQIFLIGKGGPGTMTRPIIQYIYESAFSKNDMGYGTAMSYALFLVLVILSFIQLQVQKHGEGKE